MPGSPCPGLHYAYLLKTDSGNSFMECYKTVLLCSWMTITWVWFYVIWSARQLELGVIRNLFRHSSYFLIFVTTHFLITLLFASWKKKKRRLFLANPSKHLANLFKNVYFRCPQVHLECDVARLTSLHPSSTGSGQWFFNSIPGNCPWSMYQLGMQSSSRSMMDCVLHTVSEACEAKKQTNKQNKTTITTTTTTCKHGQYKALLSLVMFQTNVLSTYMVSWTVRISVPSIP